MNVKFKTLKFAFIPDPDVDQLLSRQFSLPDLDKDRKHAVLKRNQTLRQLTFDQTWPRKFLYEPSVPENGFYYTGVGDQVVCTGCNGALSNMAKYDNRDFKDVHFIELVHSEISANCRNVGKAKLKRTEQLRKSLYHAQNFDASRATPSWDPAESVASSESSGDASHEPVCFWYTQPKYPEYESFEERRALFDSNFLVDADRMASAGMLPEPIQGELDRAVCFWCGGSLHSWERDEDPWEPHAQHYPACSYVRRMRGSLYILEQMRAEEHAETATAVYIKGDQQFIETACEMQREKRRDASYKRFATALPGNAVTMAVSGGFYLMHPGLIQCFFCGLLIKNWTQCSNLHKLHRANSPNCIFLTNPAESGNIPYYADTKDDVVYVPIQPAGRHDNLFIQVSVEADDDGDDEDMN